MAQSKTTRPVNSATAARSSAAQEKVTQALTDAARQAKKQLAAQGQKLPTQNWKGSTIRNPAI